MNEAPKLTKREEDLQWVREEFWNKAGEKLAKKLTQNDENGIAYTLTDAMEIIANHTNARIDMYENPLNEDGTKKTEAEIEEDKAKADYLKGTRFHQTEQLAVSTLNERIEDMNQESPEEISAQEQIRQNLLQDIDNGFKRIQTLSQQLARGADVAGELEELKESLYQRMTKGIEDTQLQVNSDEFGGMDAGRFETETEPAYIRAQNEGK